MAKGTGLRTNLGKTARGIIHHLRPNLGKTAGDLLSKNCQSDQKFSSSTCSENGVAICSSGTKKGEVFLADVNTQPKQKNFKVDTSSRPSRQWRKVQDRLEDDERCSRLEKIDLLEEEEEEQRRIQKDQLRGAEDLNSVSDINLQASCSSGTKEGKVFVADFQLQSSVKTVVKFFESLSKEKGGGEEGKDMEKDGEEEDEKKKLALPGVHQTNCLTSCSKEEKEEVVKKRGRHQPKSVSSLNSRQRRYSSEGSSSATCKEKQLEITRPEPFKLQTEQRGKKKEEDEYLKRMCQLTKEEKRRIPIAQGVPLTTDEPEILIKPPVKDITRPLDSQLHSDARAVKRADFDSKIAEKLITCQEYKTGKNRREKAEEEEEVERLRKEQIPRALPMLSFDRPFIPKRSTKCPTIPKEPKFQVLHHRRNASSMF